MLKPEQLKQIDSKTYELLKFGTRGVLTSEVFVFSLFKGIFDIADLIII